MKTQTLGSATRRALFAAAFCAAALPSLAEDWTVDADTTLTADTTVDALTVEDGVTLDLNGYSLTCSSLAGSGTITSPSGTLTSPDTTEPYHVTWITKFGTDGAESNGNVRSNNSNQEPPRNLFTNTGRLLATTDYLPLAVTYDFCEGVSRKVDKYKVSGPSANAQRGPKAWTLEGSNDGLSWTEVDSITGESWSNNQSKEFTVDESKVASYRYYRMIFTASNDGVGSSKYLELNQLEYFNTNPGELHVNVGAGEAVNSTVTISGNVKVVKEGAGTLSGITQIANGSGSSVEMVVDGGSVTTAENFNISTAGGAGTLTVNSGVVEVTGAVNTFLNPNDSSSSTGTINLNAGGTLKTRRIFSKAAARGTLNFNGGTLQQNSSHNLSGGLIVAATTVNVLENGGTIDSSDYAVTVGAAIGGTGAMKFKGGNTITLEGASDYTGGTTIELGTKIITSNETAKNTILGNLVIDGKSQLTDATGIEVFQYGSALADPDDLANVTLVNCGAGSAARIDGNKIVVDFVAPSWALDANANWSDLVATYGTPAAGETVRIAASGAYTLTIDQNVAVGQIVFTGSNPNVVVNSGATVTADTISFSGSGTSYLKNDGVIVLNGSGETTLPFHNDSRGVYYVNNAGKLKVSSVTQGSTTPGLLPEGTNQFVCVASGATYNMNGIADNTVSVRLAAGATVANDSETSVISSNKQIPQLILDGDATAKVHHSFGLIGTGHSETRLDLGEHTLTITGGGNTYSFFLGNTTVSGNGKILVTQGKLSAVNNSQVVGGTVEIGPSGYLAITKVTTDTPFTVHDFVNNGTDSSDSTAGALIVTGTLTPGNDIKKLTLAGGSSIKASTTAAQTVTTAFSASGTVTIDASDVTAQQLKDATDGRIAVLTAPGDAATLNALATWRVLSEPISGSRAKWISNGDSTSTLYLSRPTGLIIIFR